MVKAGTSQFPRKTLFLGGHKVPEGLIQLSERAWLVRVGGKKYPNIEQQTGASDVG